MHRRSFLQLFGKGLLVSTAAGIVPSVVWGKSAFDYALEGQNLIQTGDYRKAVEVLKKAVELDPQSDWTYGLLGRSYRGLGKQTDALQAFRKAVRLNPEDVYSRMMIEIMTQKPIPRKRKEKAPLTPLESAAAQEDARMVQFLGADEGLSYQVKRVVLDPGHGGFDSGAVGYSGLKEKDVTLDIAKMLHKRLVYHGKIQSFLTRTDDYYVPLTDRTATANQYRADLFISLHSNASKNRNASGSETYFCSETASNKEAARVASFENAVLKYDEPYKKRKGYIDIEEVLFRLEQKLNWGESGKFAHKFQGRFKQGLPLKSRGVNSANFFVLRRTKMPSILLEIGFISNQRDEARLGKKSFREKVADSILQGFLS